MSTLFLVPPQFCLYEFLIFLTSVLKTFNGSCIVHRDFDGRVTPEEVAAAAIYLKDTLDKEEGVQELISNLSKDRGQTFKSSPTVFCILDFN